jgi:hypothetical protein
VAFEIWSGNANGGEKDPMPFSKVVEQCKIYNFGIQMLVHFSSNFWRKTPVKAGRLKWVLTRALQSARAGVAVPRPR